jgi:hypothetical protein
MIELHLISISSIMPANKTQSFFVLKLILYKAIFGKLKSGFILINVLIIDIYGIILNNY